MEISSGPEMVSGLVRAFLNGRLYIINGFIIFIIYLLMAL